MFTEGCGIAVEAGFSEAVPAGVEGPSRHSRIRGVPNSLSTTTERGDYGPQNLILDTASWEVSAVLDWEFAHDGDPVEDLAWVEWILRMHHPGAAGATPALCEGYGPTPSWPVRHAAMLEKCLKLEELCRHRGQEDAVSMWQLRAQITQAWSK